MILLVFSLLSISSLRAVAPPSAGVEPTLLVQSNDCDVCCFSPDSRFVATQGSGNLVKVWTLDPVRMIAETRLPGHYASTLGFSRTNRSLYILSGRRDPHGPLASLWQWRFPAQSLRLVTRIPQQYDSFAQSPNGDWLAFGDPGGGVIVLNSLTRRTREIKTGLYTDAFGNGDDGSVSVMVVPLKPARGQVIHFDREGKEIRRTAIDSEPSYFPAFSKDRKLVAVADRANRVTVLDSISGKHIRSFESKAESMRRASFSSDGRRLFTVGSSGSGHEIPINELWNLDSGKLIARYVRVDIGAVDERLRLASSIPSEWSSSPQPAGILALVTRRGVAVLPQCLDSAVNLEVGDSGRLLHLLLSPGRALLFDVSRLAPVFQTRAIWSTLSPDGRVLLLNRNDGIRALDWKSGRQLWSDKDHGRAAVSPDSRTVALFPYYWKPTGGFVEPPPETVALYDLTSGKKLKELARFDRTHTCEAVFSPTGELACTFGWGLPITLWDVRTGNEALTIGDDFAKKKVRPVLVRDRWIAAIIFDGYLRLYDAKNGNRRWERLLDSPSEPFAELSTTDDSKNIRVSYEFMTVEYDIRTGKRLA